jgi:hypothetical protein
VGQTLRFLTALLMCMAPVSLAAQGNPASAPDTAEGMSRATDTTSTITPGVNDPASTPDTAEGMSSETDTTSTITPGVRDPASTPDTSISALRATRPEAWAPPGRFRTRWSEPRQTTRGLLSAF